MNDGVRLGSFLIFFISSKFQPMNSGMKIGHVNDFNCLNLLLLLVKQNCV